MRRKKDSVYKSLFLNVFWGLVLAVIIRTFVIEPFYIPSGSMKNTLFDGDFILVSKYAYGYSNHSFPFSPGIIEDRVLFSEPKRGDVIVFRAPYDDKISYIKRLIGLPGDKVKLRAGHVIINGNEIKRVYMGDVTYSNALGNSVASMYKETLDNGKEYNVILVDTDGTVENTKEFIVPDGSYFVLGDNRDDSQDSRFPKVGFIPKKNLIGKGAVVVFSIDNSNKSKGFLPFALRLGRLFKFIN